MIASHTTDERTPIMSAYPTTITPAEFSDVMVSVHFQGAVVEVPSYGLKDRHELVEAAKSALARHLGPSVYDWQPISDRRNVSDLVSWAGADAETDAFYLRASGSHGWFNRASWKITQTG